MIIDAHVHMGPAFTVESKGRLMSHDTLTPQGMLAMMDDCLIDKGMVFPPIWGGGDEFLDPDYLQSNEAVAQAQALYPTRVIGYGRVSPNLGTKAVRLAERCIEEWQLKGLMLHPDWDSFSVNDRPVMDPLMELLREHDYPVIFHSGYGPADPVGFMQLAERFPDVPIMLKHMGYQIAEDAIEIARRVPNVYLETSANWQNLIAHALRVLGPERIMFGSDGPYHNPLQEHRKLSMLPGIDAAALESILWRNAARANRIEAEIDAQIAASAEPSTTATGPGAEHA